MSLEVQHVEGTTYPYDFTLKLEGSAVNRDGATIEVEFTDADGDAVAFAGTCAWISAAAGTVRVTPTADDLPFSTGQVRARFKVTLGGQVEYFPNAAPDVWRIRKP